MKLFQLLEIDVLKGPQKLFELRRVENDLPFLFLDVGQILAQDHGEEAGLVDPVKQIILGILVAVVKGPVGSKIHQIQQRPGQIVFRQPQRFPCIHVDAVGVGIGVHRQAVELAVLHEDLAELRIHAPGHVHQRFVAGQVGAVALLQKPVHRHVVQAQEQYVVGVGIADHGLGQCLQIVGIIPRHLHGDLRVGLGKVSVSIGTAFAEDAQRAFFQRRAVEQVLIQPGIGGDVVAVLAQHGSVGVPAVHALAGVGRDLAFPGLRVNAHDPGAVHVIHLLPVAAEAAQIVNAHLTV